MTSHSLMRYLYYVNPIIAEALHLKPGPTTRSHGPWHFHGSHKYRLRSIYMHGPASMNRPYLVVGTHCPLCGFAFSEQGEGVRIADIVQAEPIGKRTRASLRKLAKAKLDTT